MTQKTQWCRALTLCVMGLWSMMAMAQTPMWQDPGKNSDNRRVSVADFFAFENDAMALAGKKEQSSRFLSMDGTWKFNFVRNANERPQGFFAVGYDDSDWDTMPVPGMWEMNGFGEAIYVNTDYSWRNDWEKNPPVIKELNNWVGSYRRSFLIPANWNGEQIIMHIGSATSNVTVWVNGQYVGYSEDAKVAAEFDVTKYLKPGQENLIALQVMRWCDGSYLEDQDFWRLCGLARETYLYSRPKAHIEDLFVHALGAELYCRYAAAFKEREFFFVYAVGTGGNAHPGKIVYKIRRCRFKAHFLDISVYGGKAAAEKSYLAVFFIVRCFFRGLAG